MLSQCRPSAVPTLDTVLIGSTGITLELQPEQCEDSSTPTFPPGTGDIFIKVSLKHIRPSSLLYLVISSQFLRRYFVYKKVLLRGLEQIVFLTEFDEKIQLGNDNFLISKEVDQ